MIELKAQKREKKEKKENLLEVFGVVYGKQIENNILVKLDLNSVEKIYDEFGTSNIISLNVDGDIIDVLIKDIQVDPVKNFISHIDFYAIVKGEEIEVEVPFEFVGESEAVKKGGVLNTVISDVFVKTIPSKIPSSLEVDLSKLSKDGDVVKLSDIQLPEGVEYVLENPEEIIVVSVAEGVEDTEEEVQEAPSTEEKKDN